MLPCGTLLDLEGPDRERGIDARPLLDLEDPEGPDQTQILTRSRSSRRTWRYREGAKQQRGRVVVTPVVVPVGAGRRGRRRRVPADLVAVRPCRESGEYGEGSGECRASPRKRKGNEA